MAKLKTFLNALIGLVFFLLILWGLTELIVYIFKINDSGIKENIRWALLLLFILLGALIRIFVPHWLEEET